MPGVALWAHVGGFVAGFASGAAFRYEEVRRSGPWLCLLALGAVLCVLAAFFLYLGLPSKELEQMLQLPPAEFYEVLRHPP
jgi:hypothetical protein